MTTGVCRIIVDKQIKTEELDGSPSNVLTEADPPLLPAQCHLFLLAFIFQRWLLSEELWLYIL